MLTVNSVSYEINNRTLVKDISFHLGKGEMMAILGANGAGKSTLLRLLSAERKPAQGSIEFFHRDLGDYTSHELAKKRAVLNQQNAVSMPFQAEEVVMMGRYPHFSNSPLPSDRIAVQEAMEICGVSHLAERSFVTLSGGEQQRVQFARILAQVWDQPEALILMDEPVAGLDLQYQQQTLAITKALCRKGFMVIAILHEINLAAQYADRILMLRSGRKWQDGSPAEVLTPPHIYTVFNVETEVIINPKTLRPYVIQKEIRLNAREFNSMLKTHTSATMTLKEKYASYQEQHPKKRIRDIAQALGVSEAELLMTGLGETVTLLRPEAEAILRMVPALGYVMALTRNDDCVHERKGFYRNFSSSPQAALFVGEDIDLRLFLQHWHLAFAVEEQYRKSLQFFDACGTALHKIYLTDQSDRGAWSAIVSTFSDAQQQPVAIQPAQPVRSTERSDASVDAEGFRKAWNSMRDTHEFFGLLKRYGLSRTQALRLAPEGRAKAIETDDFKRIIGDCSERQLPIMVFTGNHGCIQIHTGPVNNIIGMNSWYNIMDPEFNLHLREDAVAGVWHVVKPSADGDINSIEVFNKKGELIVQFFGKRKPGRPELEEWRNILAGIAV